MALRITCLLLFYKYFDHIFASEEFVLRLEMVRLCGGCSVIKINHPLNFQLKSN